MWCPPLSPSPRPAHGARCSPGRAGPRRPQRSGRGGSSACSTDRQRAAPWGDTLPASSRCSPRRPCPAGRGRCQRSTSPGRAAGWRAPTHGGGPCRWLGMPAGCPCAPGAVGARGAGRRAACPLLQQLSAGSVGLGACRDPQSWQRPQGAGIRRSLRCWSWLRRSCRLSLACCGAQQVTGCPRSKRGRADPGFPCSRWSCSGPCCSAGTAGSTAGTARCRQRHGAVSVPEGEHTTPRFRSAQRLPRGHGECVAPGLVTSWLPPAQPPPLPASSKQGRGEPAVWGSLGTPSPFSPWPGPLRVFSPDITTRGPGEAEGIGGAVHGRGVGADFGKLGHVPGMGPEDGHAPPCQEQQRERTRMGRKPGRGTGAEVTSYGVSCPPPHPQASAHLRGTAVIGGGPQGSQVWHTGSWHRARLSILLPSPAQAQPSWVQLLDPGEGTTGTALCPPSQSLLRVPIWI